MDIKQSSTTTELLGASVLSLRRDGECEKAHVIQVASCSSPKTLHSLKDVCEKERSNIKQYSVEQALAMIVDCKLSDVYNVLPFGAIEQGIDLYPSYYKILQEKKKRIRITSKYLILNAALNYKIY